MPRKTKAELIAEEEAKLQTREAELQTRVDTYVRDYPKRLMTALHRASIYCFRIDINKDNLFEVCDSCSSYECFKLPYAIEKILWFAPLEDLISALDEKDKEVKERDRLQKVKAGALAKLTEEEREVLDL